MLIINNVCHLSKPAHVIIFPQVSGEDKVRGRGLGYSVGRWQVSEGLSSGRWGGSLVEAAREKFGFVTSFTRLRRANKVILSLTHGG